MELSRAKQEVNTVRDWRTRQRLDHLEQVVSRAPADGFDLRFFYVQTNRNECGTIACAAGWACLDPTFRAMGLHLDSRGVPSYDGRVAGEALAEFFGISHDHACYLFNGCARAIHEHKAIFFDRLRQVRKESDRGAY